MEEKTVFDYVTVLCYICLRGGASAMEQELISKKDLLELTEISYGQLYRWKRKNLIPEEWFIRKSTFTGQETFFPKQKILSRIEKIKHMKDDLSLDELADVFTPQLREISITAKELLKQNIVSQVVFNLFQKQHAKTDVLGFDELLYLSVLQKLLHAGVVSQDEGLMMLETLEAHYPKLRDKAPDLIFTRKMGVSSFLLTSSENELFFDNGVKVVTRLNLGGCIEEMKLTITEG